MSRTFGCLAIALALAVVGCSRDVIPPPPPGPPTEPTTTPYSLLERAPASITWKRSGGFAGLCQQVVIWSDGSYKFSTTCRSSESQSGVLAPSERDQLQAWLATYQAFDWSTHVPPGSADMFVDHLQFNGEGQEPAPAALQSRISGTISDIVSRLMVSSVPTPLSDGGQQGIQGRAVMGPMCPVMSDANSCPDKPYQGTLQVLDSNGKLVTEFSTATDGSFSVALPPGDYTIQGTSRNVFPRAPRTDVTVAPGQFTQIDLTFDTGIR